MRILYTPGDGGVDLGGGLAVGAAEGDGDAGAGEGVPAGFDWANKLPDALPDSLKQFAGKTFQDVADSAGNAQTKIGDQGNQIKTLTDANTELQEGLKKAQDQVRPADDPEVRAAATAQAQEMMQKYQAATEHYMETGEIDDDVLTAIEGQGVRVNKETLVEFMEFQRFKLGNTVDNLVEYAAKPDTINKEMVGDVLAWLKSGESPFDINERKGFDRMMKSDNFAFFDTVLQSYNEEFGGAAPAADAPAFRRKKTMKKVVRGRPIMTPDNKGFASTRDFQEQLIAIRADKDKTQPQRNTAEAELIARRRVQRGD